jgi:cytochrome c peroxidase
LDSAIPNDALMLPFAQQVPITFLARGQNPAAWDKLPGFWNETQETVPDPITGKPVLRRKIVLKVPLGLNSTPVSPPENPITLAKWELGKKLYHDKLLSSNNSVSCATCHAPDKGFTDQRKTSLGINSSVGGMNAPTVLNSGYHRLQFWDGRAATLEEQAQGPVGNALEMFGGKADENAWDAAANRLRLDPVYSRQFQQVFGHLPTRDAAAKAIAAFERTVLSGNSLHDRADLVMRKRVAEEETGKYELIADDYAAALKEAAARRDSSALEPLGFTIAQVETKAAELGARLVNGRNLFFGKARCTNCHVGENFTDNQFHNLGIGAANGLLPEKEYGRYVRLATGHKDPSQIGAFKTPGLRALHVTAPYMHDGSETTLEAVVELYNRGGNANEFLSAKMRDTDAEDAYVRAKAEGTPYTGPKPALFSRGGRPIIPRPLGLTEAEKADLVLWMKALAGEPADPIVADPNYYPTQGQRVSVR